MMAAPSSAPAASDVEEKTEFDVVLEEVPAPKKIAVLKLAAILLSWLSCLIFRSNAPGLFSALYTLFGDEDLKGGMEQVKLFALTTY